MCNLNIVVFSKNRPAQLDLCLESLRLGQPGNIYILYCSDPNFNSGYELCKEYHDNVIFCEQSSFKKDLVDLIGSDSEYIKFLTDDSLFFRQSQPLEDIIGLFNTFPIATYSNRLGEDNCIRQSPQDPSSRCEMPKSIKFGDYRVWNWQELTGNYAYPLSVDGNIFRTDLILPLIKDTTFNNPNYLEANLQQHLNKLPRYMASYKTSSLVNSPSNRVQDEFQNSAGVFHPMSILDLNKKFLEGKRLKLPDNLNVNGAHQEIALEFICQ